MTAKKEMPDQVGHDKTLNCFLFYFTDDFGVRRQNSAATAHSTDKEEEEHPHPVHTLFVPRGKIP
jgi:hypothetical protein